MMASKKSSAPQRPRAGGKKGQLGKYQYLIAAGGAVALIVVVLVVLGGGNKPKPPPKPKAKDSQTQSAKSSKSKQVQPGGRNVREERRAARELERKKRAEARAEGRGKRSRSSGGGFSRSSRSAGAPNQLTMIVTDPSTNERYALVGERRYKAGQDIEGRKIVEVGSDAVKLEYRQNTYSVRVGQPVY